MESRIFVRWLRDSLISSVKNNEVNDGRSGLHCLSFSEGVRSPAPPYDFFTNFSMSSSSNNSLRFLKPSSKSDWYLRQFVGPPKRHTKNWRKADFRHGYYRLFALSDFFQHRGTVRAIGVFHWWASSVVSDSDHHRRMGNLYSPICSYGSGKTRAKAGRLFA